MTTIGQVQSQRPVTGAPRPAVAPTPTQVRQMGRDDVQLTSSAPNWRVSTGNRFEPLVDRGQVVPAVMDTIRGAKQSLQLSSYLFGGQITQQIAEALVERKQAGVNVQVLLDPKLAQVGQDDDGKAIAYLKAHGVDVLTYPTSKLNEGEPRWKQGNAIDHAKAVIADSRVAIAGGMNLSDKGVEAHDFMVRIQGQGATQLSEAFGEDWELAGGKRADLPKGPTPPAVDGGRLTISEHSATRDNLAKLVTTEIQGAKKSVAVEALFLDHPDYLKALLDAHARGVDVQVLLDQSAIKQFIDFIPGGKYARDLPVDTLPNLPAIAQLKKAGIPVHLYDPHDGMSYLHGKLAVIDDRVTLLGSANFTLQAAQNNRELMLAIDDADTAKGFKDVFKDDWEHHSTEVKELPRWQRTVAPWMERAHELIFGKPEES